MRRSTTAAVAPHGTCSLKMLANHLVSLLSDMMKPLTKPLLLDKHHTLKPTGSGLFGIVTTSICLTCVGIIDSSIAIHVLGAPASRNVRCRQSITGRTFHNTSFFCGFVLDLSSTSTNRRWLLMCANRVLAIILPKLGQGSVSAKVLAWPLQ
jgi:hypothetical protein